MLHPGPSHSQDHAAAAADSVTDLLDLLQSAPAGNRELDARIDCFLNDHVFDGMLPGVCYRCRAFEDDPAPRAAEPASRWSQDLTALLGLAPSNYNYSLGERDGVLWAWIQPNDDWTPMANAARHDHPGGSGLIVAHTMPLALAAAIVTLRALLRRGYSGLV